MAVGPVLVGSLGGTGSWCQRFDRWPVRWSALKSTWVGSDGNSAKKYIKNQVTFCHKLLWMLRLNGLINFVKIFGTDIAISIQTSARLYVCVSL